MIAIKILAVLGIIVGIYFFIEEQLDIKLNSSKSDDSDGSSSPSGRYLESVTGASLDEQLIEVLLMISSCLKAGRNLDQAFELVAVSTPPPICNEFRTLVQERRLGVPMVEALGNLADRVPSKDLRLAVNATIFQQETGGNLEDLYTQILLTISERKKIMGKIVAGTAHARLSGNMVATIPVLLAIFLATTQPDYLRPMLSNPMGQIALLIAIAATVIGVVFINRMTASILPDAEEAMISKNNSSARGKNKYKTLRLILKPFMVVMNLIPEKYTTKIKSDTKFLLSASGKAEEFDVEEFMGLRLLSTLIFALVLFLIVNPSIMGVLAWVVFVALMPIGFMLPRIYLAHLIRKRQKNIEFELPYVIDLLSLAIESGLDLTGGIAKVVEKSRNTDIIVEFKMFLADIKVGKSMEEALADMAERVKVLSFFSFVSSLIQAQRLGADIGPTLRAQAEQMRYQRMILAEERVNKLPVKLLIPLVFFVFPSISVLLIGPAMIQIQTKFPKANTHKSERVQKPQEKVKLPNAIEKTANEVKKAEVVETKPVEMPKQIETTATKAEKQAETAIDNQPTAKVVTVPEAIPAPIIITEPVNKVQEKAQDNGVRPTEEAQKVNVEAAESTGKTPKSEDNVTEPSVETLKSESNVTESVTETPKAEANVVDMDIKKIDEQPAIIIEIKNDENDENDAKDAKDAINSTSEVSSPASKMVDVEVILDEQH